MLDDMTNIKASEVIKELKDYTEDLPHYSPDEVAEALEMANKALDRVSHLNNRPCEACEYHKETGCVKWECVFER